MPVSIFEDSLVQRSPKGNSDDLPKDSETDKLNEITSQPYSSLMNIDPQPIFLLAKASLAEASSVKDSFESESISTSNFTKSAGITGESFNKLETATAPKGLPYVNIRKAQDDESPLLLDVKPILATNLTAILEKDEAPEALAEEA